EARTITDQHFDELIQILEKNDDTHLQANFYAKFHETVQQLKANGQTEEAKKLVAKLLNYTIEQKRNFYQKTLEMDTNQLTKEEKTDLCNQLKKDYSFINQRIGIVFDSLKGEFPEITKYLAHSQESEEISLYASRVPKLKPDG